MHSPALPKVVLMTGAVKRIGANLARQLHALGMNLMLHYRYSEAAADALQAELNAIRPASVGLVQADLLDIAGLPKLVQTTLEHFGQLDVLINNASSFYPTPVGEITLEHWADLIGSNLQAPLFLSQAAAPHLKQQQGCIINIVDIHGERPLKNYPLYSVAKAGLIMVTKALAKELAPDVRVNGIAPGAILWAEQQEDDTVQRQVLAQIALQRCGSPDDIAQAAIYLMTADYVTGQILQIDGGRTLNQ